MTKSGILIILGTKAQFVKMAPVIQALESHDLSYTLLYTGQHSETFEEMQAAFGTRSPDMLLVPQYEADTHMSFLRWMTRFWLSALSKSNRDFLKNHNIAVVHGDTASTIFGSLLARMLRIKVAHVEAGLRSTQIWAPFPEEIIRRLVSRLTNVHFCPDSWAMANLRNRSGLKVMTEGNTLQDSLQLALDRLESDPNRQMPGSAESFGLVSMHRHENISSRKRFEKLLGVIVEASEILPLKFVLHPATRKRLEATGWVERLEELDSIELLDRMDYFRFVALIWRSRFILTDGGSNQEEAAQLGIPCLLLRKNTERLDGLERNVQISNLERGRILEFISLHQFSRWNDGFRRQEMSSPSEIIVNTLSEYT